MRPGKNRTVTVAVALAATAFALTACDSSDPAAPPAAPASAGQGSAQAAAAPEAARVGAAGSGCELPVTFGVAQSYRPKRVAVAADDPLAELARKGPLTMVCEIDAKPAGNLGFLRVYTGGKGELRTTLEAFIGTRALESQFTEARIGGLPGLEAVYRVKSSLDDEIEPERAFVVQTAQGTVAVALDSLGDGEHAAILPAYLLARDTLKPVD